MYPPKSEVFTTWPLTLGYRWFQRNPAYSQHCVHNIKEKNKTQISNRRWNESIVGYLFNRISFSSETAIRCNMVLSQMIIKQRKQIIGHTQNDFLCMKLQDHALLMSWRYMHGESAWPIPCRSRYLGMCGKKHKPSVATAVGHPGWLSLK